MGYSRPGPGRFAGYDRQDVLGYPESSQDTMGHSRPRTRRFAGYDR